MSKLFNESDASDDEEKGFKINNEYAKNYNNWRQKEELNKLKTKYGETFDEENSDSSSSDDDSDGALITEDFEKEFFKTLSSLKEKDPKIYDENTRFFENTSTESPMKFKKKNKDEPMFLKDYERKILLEKGADFDEENEENPNVTTYNDEQKKLIDDLKKGLDDIDDNDDDDTFKVRLKTKEAIKEEEEDYKRWLLGEKEKIDDESVQKDLKPLKEFWTNPKLDKKEKFLRDYILNKRFLEQEDENYIPSYEEIIHDSDEGISEDEIAVERQDEFEHKYNYRFEEPDAEFIKRYPRTMENSVRKKDDRRKQKRVEIKERKEKEKEQKMEDIRKMKELKRKEIEEKIQKLREITGNKDMNFQDDDLEGDFDPEAHDKRMQALFNEDFYCGDEGDEKPKFPEIDEELEIENWDQYEDNNNEEGNGEGPHCEDEDFNMDCDYNPNEPKKTDVESTGKKKRKRKSNFAKLIQEPKPVFNPNDKTYEEYLEEYYKMDCEDIIGDVPCRFKYRKVVPNSFGLSIEEILMAKDRELNRWCSLKKAVQIRPEQVEKYDVIAYQKKGKNEVLKKKILSSLYEEKIESDVQPSTSGQTVNDSKRKGTKRKRNQDKSNVDYAEIVKELNQINEEQEKNEKVTSGDGVQKKKKLKKAKNKAKVQTNDENNIESVVKKDDCSKEVKENNNQKDIINKKKRKVKSSEMRKQKPKKIKKKQSNEIDISDARLKAFGIKPKKFKNKIKYGKK